MPPAPQGAARVPRDVITEEALSVHPSLLGLPLARPWRRGAAMAIDGLLVTLLTQTPGVLFGVASALVLLRASARPRTQGGYLRRSLRLGLRFGGAVVLFMAAVSGWSSARSRLDRSSEAALFNPFDTATFAAALTSAASAGAPTPAEPAGSRSAQIRSLRAERDRLAKRVQELESGSGSGGVVPMLRDLANDLGIGFGWIGLYFTATLALWQGRTPGKRALGIRVVRLNAKPIGWWIAFERFGGYAAGFATGLLGFLQILWDHNRQGIHDKITETAVVREG
jgi:hypothetical protein